MGTLYKNKKNNLIYEVVDEVINCTNDRDGQRMHLYKPANKNLLFVREKKEFHEKFEEINRRLPEPEMTEGVDPLTVFRELASRQQG